MKTQNSFSHLTLEERRIILAGITNGSTKTAIAQTIGKDKSTVGKEIKLHRSLTHKCKMPLECNHYKKCVYGRLCTPDCPEYSPFHCSRPKDGLQPQVLQKCLTTTFISTTTKSNGF